MFATLLFAVAITAGPPPAARFEFAPRPERAVELLLADKESLIDAYGYDAYDHTRYLWCRGDNACCMAAAGAINIGPSLANTTYAPRLIAGGELLAVDLTCLVESDSQLETLCRNWDKLAIDEPFFHSTTWEDYQADTLDKDGKKTGTETKRRRVAINEYDLIPGRIVDGRWFTRQALGSIDGALYLDFRGLIVGKTLRKDYLKSRGADGVKDAAKAKATGLSRITERDRDFELFRAGTQNPTIGTALLAQTNDHFLDNHREQSDVFRNLLGATADGFEIIVELPNGWPEFTLFAQATDLLVRTAPDNLARDSEVPKPYCCQLHGAMSCIVCHGPDAGWRPMTDYVRKLQDGELDILGQIAKRKSSADAIRLVAANHQGDTEKAFILARDSYNSRVIRACSPWIKAAGKANGAAIEFAEAVRTIRDEVDYPAHGVTAEMAARDLGVMFRALKSYDDPKQQAAAEKTRTYEILAALAELLPADVEEDAIIGLVKEGLPVAPAQWRQVLPIALHRSNGPWVQMKLEAELPE